jgi:succinate dehydrogenase / fumarate reductase, membrane anchor subunit
MSHDSHNAYRSPLSKAKNLGSAKDGVSHWWWQRLTALAVTPLSIWVIVSLVSLSREPGSAEVADWMASPYNALLSGLFLVAMFYHAKLGMQVVIEDYVHCKTKKMTLLLLNILIFTLAGAASLMAIGKLHFMP